jgi:hypothetical protein
VGLHADRKILAVLDRPIPTATRNHAETFLTPLMAVEPIVYHGMSQCFRLFAVAGYDFSGAFNIIRMNGYVPLIAFDPGADGVPYASILHKDIFVERRVTQSL